MMLHLFDEFGTAPTKRRVTCVSCNEPFQAKTQTGRPRKRCYECSPSSIGKPAPAQGCILKPKRLRPDPALRGSDGHYLDKRKLATAAKRAATPCGHCGGPVGGTRMKFCSPRCLRRRFQRKEVPCFECGVLFETRNSKSKFCTKRCAKRSNDRKHTARRRAAYRSGEDVVHVVVFERDGWRCQICKRKTPRELIGLQVPRSPELDHIVPLSQGGAHTYANVQCLCHDCNMEKGATTYGQLRLFE